nr:ribonuclease H-like domain-containing protein [Tanacetum cinerariifolium]
MEVGATTTMTVKLPILNPGEYDLWLMRIEPYFLMTDYSFWEVIKNRNKVLKKTVGTSEETYEPTSAEEKLNKRNEMKARGTLTSNTNKADTTTSGVSTTHTQEDLEKIDPDDLAKIDLHWEMAMLTIKARRFMKRTDMNLDMNENALIAQDGIRGYDWSYQAKKEIPTNYAFMALTSSGSSSSSESEVDSCSKSCMKAYANLKEQYDSLTSDYKKSQYNLLSCKAGLQSVEERLVHYKKNEAVLTNKINVLNLEVKLRDKVLAEYTKNLEKAKKERDELKLTLEKLQNSSKSLNNLLDSQVSDKSKAGLGYKGITPDSFVDSSEILEKQENRSNKEYHGMFNIEEPKHVMKNNFSPTIIQDCHSDDESEVDISPTVEVKIIKPSIEQIEFVKTTRETVKNEESPKQHKHRPRGNQRNWNNLMSQRLGSNFKLINKACYVCGIFKHIHYVRDKKDVRPMRNNSNGENHKNFANKLTHPHPKRGFVPQAVLTRSGKINTAVASVTTAGRPVNTAGSKSTVNHPRLTSKSYKRGHSHKA